MAVVEGDGEGLDFGLGGRQILICNPRRCSSGVNHATGAVVAGVGGGDAGGQEADAPAEGAMVGLDAGGR